VKVTVPIGAAPPASTAEIAAAAIGRPAVGLAAARADSVGLARGAVLSSTPCVLPELST
jgi:hypothetical protein